MNRKCNKNKAFTLAEILITLLIIGVVSSLVIPSLLNDTNDQELRTQWKKQFATLSQAFYQIQVENAGYIDNSSSLNLMNELSNKLSFQKIDTWGNITTLPSDFYYKCYKATESTNQCMGWQSLSLGNTMITAITRDGAYIFNTGSDPECNAPNHRIRLIPTDTVPTYTKCAEIAIDVNGDKGPNMIGKDYQLAILVKYQGYYYFKPSGSGYLSPMGCYTDHPDNYNYSLGCSNKALLNGDMP